MPDCSWPGPGLTGSKKFNLGGVKLEFENCQWFASSVDVSLSLLQNALPSDEDDKDPNDPYKALDIDLDK